MTRSHGTVRRLGLAVLSQKDAPQGRGYSIR
jgi:hypothetical protein